MMIHLHFVDKTRDSWVGELIHQNNYGIKIRMSQGDTIFRWQVIEKIQHLPEEELSRGNKS